MLTIKPLEVVKNALSRSVEWVCVVLILALTILSIISVIMRYALNIVFIQTEELITFLFVASVFLGTVTVMQKKEHVNVTQIQNNVSGWARKALVIFQYIVVIAVQIIFVYASYHWISTNISFKTPGLRIPFWTIYWVVPFSAVLSAVIAVIDLIETILTPTSAEIFAKKVEE